MSDGLMPLGKGQEAHEPLVSQVSHGDAGPGTTRIMNPGPGEMQEIVHSGTDSAQEISTEPG